jgi:hypothetical protein
MSKKSLKNLLLIIGNYANYVSWNILKSLEKSKRIKIICSLCKYDGNLQWKTIGFINKRQQ